VSAPPRRPSSGLGERIVAAFLFVAALALATIQFRIVPAATPPEPDPFDLLKPLLDAEVGECVGVESESQPGVVTCVKVVAPGVVVRPHLLRQQLGLFGDLSRSAPYVTCRLRFPPGDKGCDDPRAREEDDLYPLGGFGLPSTVKATIDSIRPLWVRRGGQDRFVYEFQLTRHGQYIQGPVVLYVDPAQPVTGAVLRKEQVGRGGVNEVVYTTAHACGE
jgi:hypothetical protein